MAGQAPVSRQDQDPSANFQTPWPREYSEAMTRRELARLVGQLVHLSLAFGSTEVEKINGEKDNHQESKVAGPERGPSKQKPTQVQAGENPFFSARCHRSIQRINSLARHQQARFATEASSEVAVRHVISW